LSTHITVYSPDTAAYSRDTLTAYITLDDLIQHDCVQLRPGTCIGQASSDITSEHVHPAYTCFAHDTTEAVITTFGLAGDYRLMTGRVVAYQAIPYHNKGDLSNDAADIEIKLQLSDVEIKAVNEELERELNHHASTWRAGLLDKASIRTVRLSSAAESDICSICGVF
jgi:hypothetical protein